MGILSTIFNSNATMAATTLLTAVAAYGVYRRQRNDAKRDAANTILVEIQGGERKLKAAKTSLAQGNGLLENFYILTTASWSNHKSMFIKDFARDDWDAISDFYDNCQLYDEMLRRYSDMFSKNEQQVRTNASKMLENAADNLLKEILKNPVDQAEAMDKYNESSRIVNEVYLAAGVNNLPTLLRSLSMMLNFSLMPYQLTYRKNLRAIH